MNLRHFTARGAGYGNSLLMPTPRTASCGTGRYSVSIPFIRSVTIRKQQTTSPLRNTTSSTRSDAVHHDRLLTHTNILISDRRRP
jgi:hypothetical protein